MNKSEKSNYHYYCSKCGQPQFHSFSSKCCGAMASKDIDGKQMIILNELK